MPVPDFQTLMKPVLRSSAKGERHISDVVAELDLEFGLTDGEVLLSKRQVSRADRDHRAKSRLKKPVQAENTRSRYFEATFESVKVLMRGIFVILCGFSSDARRTAEKLGARIVLVDGIQLAHLMIAHEVGCRVKRTFKIAELDESFFE